MEEKKNFEKILMLAASECPDVEKTRLLKEYSDVELLGAWRSLMYGALTEERRDLKSQADFVKGAMSKDIEAIEREEQLKAEADILEQCICNLVDVIICMQERGEYEISHELDDLNFKIEELVKDRITTRLYDHEFEES